MHHPRARSRVVEDDEETPRALAVPSSVVGLGAMPKLPRITGRELLRAQYHAGWYELRCVGVTIVSRIQTVRRNSPLPYTREIL
jgi:hypothetical protein